jgi:hypothetical protein
MGARKAGRPAPDDRHLSTVAHALPRRVQAARIYPPEVELLGLNPEPFADESL